MRNTFFNSLEILCEPSKNDVVLLTGDLGFKLFDNIKKKLPSRFYDMGVAEANMASVAAGMASTGKNVFCYSIVPFLVMRAFEQIRVDIAFHNANVKLVGAGGGFAYGLEGATHWALEDVALMRSLHNMTVVVPADSYEAQCFAEIAMKHVGPMYIRLGKTGEQNVHSKKPVIQLGKALTISEGRDVAILASGRMVHTGLKVLELLKKQNIDASLVSFHTIKPLDTDFIINTAKKYSTIVTFEEHYIEGGLGSAVAEVLAENSYAGKFKRFGVTELRDGVIGDADCLREKYNLSAEYVSAGIAGLLKKKNSTQAEKIYA